MTDPKITELREQIYALVEQYYKLVAPTPEERKRSMGRLQDNIEDFMSDNLSIADDVVFEREERESDPEYDNEIKEGLHG